ncbi:MAG TPA: DUF1858 domain-containing protein [Candidatus Nanoarchaeia archaeon]|nr:DUF1858 domain-containing protein [Candidatus Nanoarchaeia archaeon]
MIAKKNEAVKTNQINEKMPLGEILQKCPESAEVMLNRGLHCLGCHASGFETLEQGAMMHGMEEKEIKQMVKEINELMKKSKGITSSCSCCR